MDYVDASGNGKPVQDERGLLRLSPRGEVLVWRHDHSIDVDVSGRVGIGDETGSLGARVTDEISIGGGGPQAPASGSSTPSPCRASRSCSNDVRGSSTSPGR